MFFFFRVFKNNLRIKGIIQLFGKFENWIRGWTPIYGAGAG